MSIYAYSGRGPGGRCRGFVEAGSPKDARAKLQGEGIVTDSVSEVRPGRRFGPAARSKFYGSAGVLLRAGFTLPQAVAMLIEEAQGDDVAPLAALRDRVMSGSPLSEAVASISPHLPGFEKSALETAEKAGVQGDMLVRLSEFIEADRGVRERVRAALAYPASVFVLALILLSLMIFVVLPKASAMFPAGRVPTSAALLIKFGPVVMGSFLFLVAVLAGTMAFLASEARKGGRMAERWERFLISLPLARRLLPLLWTSRFASTMGLLLNAGLAPQSAVSPSGSATGSQCVAAMADSAARDVANGLPLSKAISFISPIAPHLVTWMAIGEKSGSLATLLPQAAARARSEYDAILRRVLSALEPTLVGVVGAVVLFVALSVIRPMLALTTQGM